MSSYFVACDLGTETGRIVLGNLDRDHLTVSEVRRFQNAPVQSKEGWQWDIARLFQETVEGLRSVAVYDEPVDGVSCSAWASDYLLFEPDGSLITPTYRPDEQRTAEALARLSAAPEWSAVYEETGVGQSGSSTLVQLNAESSKRLRRASHLLPVADAFNFLLTGVSRVEHSSASTTQLYNPSVRAWSGRALDLAQIPERLLPPLVAPGTELGGLSPELETHTGLRDARVVSTCSHEVAAAVAGLPAEDSENWIFLRPSGQAIIGTEVPRPAISASSQAFHFTNESGAGGKTCLYKRTNGLWILEECQRYWQATDKALDIELLTHLAGSATPFESLINTSDPRFQTPGDMPLKIQAFCRETHQPIPRKPGPIFRCILESLALLYRKDLQEIQSVTGTAIGKVFLLGSHLNGLLNHFTANAIQLPVVVVPAEATAIGNIIVQAMALGRVKTLAEGREIVRRSTKMQTILPYAAAWNAAYERLVALMPESSEGS